MATKSYLRAKGKAGERELADFMSKVSGVHYRRVPMSGALHLDFPFDVMKMEKKESIFDNVGNESKNTKQVTFGEWIKQIQVACQDSGLFNNHWFIYFKQHGVPYILMSRPYFEKLTTAEKQLTDTQIK